MLSGVIGSYQWVYPKDGSCWVYRLIDDYEQIKREGYSLYPDCHDLENPLPEVYTANDNTIEAEAIKPELNSKGEPKSYTCKCGKVFHHHLPFSAHKKACK